MILICNNKLYENAAKLVMVEFIAKISQFVRFFCDDKKCFDLSYTNFTLIIQD